MAESLFNKLEVEAFRKGLTPRSKQSRQWFQDKLAQMCVKRHDLLKDPALIKRQRFGVGNMYMYMYDAKHRKTLPYYDSFPLTIMVAPAPGGFYGLNMHYLPLPIRARLFDGLLQVTNNNRYDETTKFKINYNLLKSASSLREFEPCFKHYLSDHVNSQIVMVEPSEWEIALFLPVEQFNKASKRTVWKDSRRRLK